MDDNYEKCLRTHALLASPWYRGIFMQPLRNAGSNSILALNYYEIPGF